MKSFAFLTVLTTALLATAPESSAQLRPYDPMPWELYEGESSVSARMGVAVLTGQRVSLVGTEGRLLEVGVFRASWRSGRFIVEAAGVPWRAFREEERFAPPQEEIEPDSHGDRTDSGDYLLSTTVRLSPGGAPLLAALRFGTRLPTTNNRVGLERDQTDFFAMAGARWQNPNMAVGGELGVGLHGTRVRKYEQSDVLTYAFEVKLRQLLFQPQLSVVGHADAMRNLAIRGNEELSEARLRLRAGQARWLELQLSRGLTEFSPELGLSLSGGFTH